MERLSVLILAGGQSRRMGHDKAWLSLAGQPLVEHLARRVLPIAAEIIFSTNDPLPFAALVESLPCACQTVADLHPGTGPLAGLQAGITAAHNDLVLALATDMPFVNLSLLSYMVGLARGYDVVVPLVPGQDGLPAPEPMHALYRRTCLPAIESHIQAGHRRVVVFYPDVAVRTVTPAEIAAEDPTYRSFFNTNTPEDWEQAQRWALAME